MMVTMYCFYGNYAMLVQKLFTVCNVTLQCLNCSYNNYAQFV